MRRRTEAIDTEPFGLFRHPQRSVSDQSYLITLITQLAGVDKNDRAFETGTGSEYHAAILSRLAAQVISVKVVKPLADSAARRLEKMGYTNIEVRHADG
ncbi:MAG: protein-L-isoaspartate O-methyltransferase family protein, partial [Alphaproteobacteria bacterium]